MKTLCYYTVARYIPNILRNEPKNIGLILVNEENHVFNSKFIQFSQPKFGLHLLPSDKKVIAEYTNFLSSSPFSTKDELCNFMGRLSGKIQLSEIKSVVTEKDSLPTEFDYLYRTYIEDEPQIADRSKPRLKTTIREAFKKEKLVGRHKLEWNKKIHSKRSNLSHTVDFSHQNGKLYLIDVLDLSIGDKKDTYKTAYKFEDLKAGRRNKVETISVIKKPGNEDIKEYLDALKATSTVYDLSNGGKDDLIRRVKKIVF